MKNRRVRLDACIGRGAMGEVWRGHLEGVDVPVAVKRFTSAQGVRRSRRRLATELRAVARLDHPSVVDVLAYGDDQGTPYLVTELLTGGTLASRLPKDWEETRRIVLGLLDALGHAHARGVVHRDLKPTNVLFAGPGDWRPGLRLCDFGVAVVLDETMGSRGGGTLRYMAPEQIAGRWHEVGPASDLYALGCVVWNLVSERARLDGAHTASSVAAGHLQPPPLLVPKFALPAHLEPWLRRLLARSPIDRFSHAARARRALDETAPSPRRTFVPRTDRLGGANSALASVRAVPVVGRESEQQVLWNALDRVRRQGTTEVVWLRGPLGAGRSHLATWLAEAAHEDGLVTILRARHARNVQPGVGLPGMVERHYRLHDLDRDEIVERMVWNGLPVDDAALVADLVRPSPARMLVDAEAGSLLARLLRWEADRHGLPLLLVLDDADWSATTRRWVQELAGADLPLLVVATAEGEGPAGVLDVAVGPLRSGDARVLVQHLAGLSHEATEALVRRAGGLPLPIVTRVRALAAAGAFRPGPDGLVIAQDPGLDAGGVFRLQEGLDVAGVDGHALELVAVGGLSVSREELTRAVRHLRGDDSALDAELDALLDAGVLRASSRSLRFVASSTRDAALARAASEGRLAGLHAAWFRALEGPDADLVGLKRVGRHALEAGLACKAIAPLTEAAFGAGARAMPNRALALFDLLERALTEAELPPDDPRWAELLVQRGSVRSQTSHIDLAEDDARRAIAASDDAEVLSTAQLVLAHCARRRGDLAGAEALFRGELDSPLEIRARRGLGNVLRMQGRLDDAEDVLLPGLGIDPRSDGWIHQALSAICAARGDLAGQRRHARAALVLFERLDVRNGQAIALNAIAEALRYSGDLDEAYATYDRALAWMQRLGTVGRFTVRLNMALVLVDQERFGEAAEAFGTGLAGFRRLGRHAYAAASQLGLAICAASRQDWKDWDAHLDAALRGLEDTGLVDRDVARMAELGARLAEPYDPARAAVARGLAQDQRRRLK